MRRAKGMSPYLLVMLCLLFAAAYSSQVNSQAGNTGVTVFEGARLITGDGTVIEDSAFIVERDKFTSVGRRRELTVPAGAARVDLTGKTVMPAKVDLHGHIGFQNVATGTMSKENFTRENLIDHLERAAYHGFGAVISIADLVERSDLKGGRHKWGDVPLRVREEIIPNAALFRTAGPGIAWPGSGATGHPSRSDIPYPVTTEAEAREAVRDYALMKPEFIKIWTDDRGGKMKKLTPALYQVIIEEAHKFNLPVAVHNVTLADAKELMRLGVEGWVHPPVRGGELPDEEFMALIRERIATKNRPNMWFNAPGGIASLGPEAWNDPLLAETISPQQIQEHYGEFLKNLTPEAVEKARRAAKAEGAMARQLMTAGMKLVFGSDTGQIRFLLGWYPQLLFESWVQMGFTPGEAIVMATRDSAAAAKINTGLLAAGRSADFTVLDANPLENIANTRRINKVFLRGQEVDRAGLRAKWQAAWTHTRSSQQISSFSFRLLLDRRPTPVYRHRSTD